MKYPFDPKFHHKLLKQDKLYGTTTMGARGQVVIPVNARKDLKLKPGDQLLVLGKFGRALGLIKADQLEDIVSKIMERVAGSGMEQPIKEYINKIFGKTIKSK